jgi:hypothetical protein
MQTLQAAAEEAEKGVEAVVASTAGLDDAITEKEAALQSVKDRLEEIEERARGSKNSQRKFNTELQAKLREVERHERSMASCIVAAKAVERDAMLASVDLRAGGAAQHKAGGGDRDEEEEEEEEVGRSMDLDEDTQEGSPASTAEDDDDSMPKELRADSTRLSAQLRKPLDNAARARKEAELEETISGAAQRLEDTVPNLKAPEEFQLVQAEIAALHGVRLRCPLHTGIAPVVHSPESMSVRSTGASRCCESKWFSPGCRDAQAGSACRRSSRRRRSCKRHSVSSLMSASNALPSFTRPLTTFLTRSTTSTRASR